MRNYFFNQLTIDDLHLETENECFLYEQKMNEYSFMLYALNKDRLCIKIKKQGDVSNRKILYIDYSICHSDNEETFLKYIIDDINYTISNWIVDTGIEDKIKDENYRVAYSIEHNNVTLKYISKGFQSEIDAVCFFEECIHNSEVVVSYMMNQENIEDIELEKTRNHFLYKFKDEDDNLHKLNVYIRKLLRTH